MSQENVEMLKQANAAFNRGDAAECARFFDEQAELIDLNSPPDLPRRVTGRDAIKDTLQTWIDAFEEFRAEVEEYVPIGNHVLCVTNWQGRGKDSGAAVEVRQTDSYDCQDGMIIRVTVGYRSKEEALDAVRPQE